MRNNTKISAGLGALAALLYAGAAVGLALTGDAGAQQAEGVPPSPTYVPASPGAVPDEPSVSSTDTSEEDPGATERDRTTASTRRQAAEETDDLSTGTTRVPTVDSRENLPVDPEAQPARPIEGLTRRDEDNPFEAVGIRWGTFILKPSLESGITATSNADSSVDGSSAVLSETTLRLSATSDWASHRASIDAFGTFTKTLSGQEVERFRGGVDAELELELGTEYRAKGTFTYSAEPE